MKYALLFLITWGVQSLGFSQTLTQTVKGRIVDAQSLLPLQQASIEVLDSNKLLPMAQQIPLGILALPKYPSVVSPSI